MLFNLVQANPTETLIISEQQFYLWARILHSCSFYRCFAFSHGFSLINWYETLRTSFVDYRIHFFRNREKLYNSRHLDIFRPGKSVQPLQVLDKFLFSKSVNPLKLRNRWSFTRKQHICGQPTTLFSLSPSSNHGRPYFVTRLLSAALYKLW